MVIVRSTQFKKDFKKIRTDKEAVELFLKAVDLLINSKPLPKEFKEHPLTGNLKGITDIHLKPDLLLLFRIEIKHDELHLIRIGSHAVLFG